MKFGDKQKTKVCTPEHNWRKKKQRTHTQHINEETQCNHQITMKRKKWQQGSSEPTAHITEIAEHENLEIKFRKRKPFEYVESLYVYVRSSPVFLCTPLLFSINLFHFVWFQKNTHTRSQNIVLFVDNEATKTGGSWQSKKDCMNNPISRRWVHDWAFSSVRFFCPYKADFVSLHWIKSFRFATHFIFIPTPSWSYIFIHIELEIGLGIFLGYQHLFRWCRVSVAYYSAAVVVYL